MTGVVVKGKRIGSLIGFPTANIELDPGEIAPERDGVYFARVIIDGASFYAIVNQGRHPTFPDGGKTIEAHILDYYGDAYSKRVEIEYLKFMRPEKKFPTPEDLIRRIQADEKEARQLIKLY